MLTSAAALERAPMASRQGGTTYLLTLACPDRIGVVAEVSRFLVSHDCNILQSSQYGDARNRRFFLRTEFEAMRPVALEGLATAFAPIASRFEMEAGFHDARRKAPTLLMVSKLGHCLNDLLFRWRVGALPIDIKGVVSNHLDFAEMARSAGLPFHHLPVTPETKVDQAKALADLIESVGAELVVLARYMQILPPEICARYPGRIINIHHSFLPSFKGAKPYHAAFERGVKLIGATAHYVTQDLDEGPIIEQAVERVHQNMSVQDYVATGRDIEALVLARAVKWHAERRLLLNGGRVVTFH